MTITTETQALATAAQKPAAVSKLSVFGLKRFTTPIAVLVVLTLLLWWVSTLELDSIEQRTLNWSYILLRVNEHLKLSILASALVAATAIPTGILLAKSRSRILNVIVLALANIGQATPAIGLIILLAILWKLGFATALVALVIYTFLPVLQNTIIGIKQVDVTVKESARGMGMTPAQVLFRIELPLATPVIIAGLRTALVFCVGIATAATFIDAGGLGDMVVNGMKLQRTPVLVVGAVLVASIALLIDWVASCAEDLLKPKGT